MPALPRSSCLIAGLIVAGAVGAQTPSIFLDLGGPRAPIVGPGCDGGLRHDDGSFEGAVGYANAVEVGRYAMALDIPEGYAPTRVCICWTRADFGTGTEVDYNVVFHAADGVGPKGEPGYPGTLLGSVPAVATDVPHFEDEGVGMYAVDLPPGLQALSGRVYVGAEWKPFEDRQFYLCNDAEPGGTQLRPLFEGFSYVPPEEFWWPISEERPTYRAFGTVLYGERIFDDGFQPVDP